MNRWFTLSLLALGCLAATSAIHFLEWIAADKALTRIVFHSEIQYAIEQSDTYYVLKRVAHFPIHFFILFLIFAAPVSGLFLRHAKLGMVWHIFFIAVIYVAVTAWLYIASMSVYGGPSPKLLGWRILETTPVAILAGLAFWLVAIVPHRITKIAR